MRYPTDLISVIVPVYNAGDALPRCVDSILAQRGVRFEVILVDDGSTDGSSDLCDRYAGRHPEVSVVHQRNAGPSTARNRGIEEARGSFIAFADSDDYVLPDMLSCLLEGMRRFDADVCCCGFTKNQAGELSDCPITDTPREVKRSEYLYDMLFTPLAGYPFNRMYRRDAIGPVRFDEGMDFAEDLIFNCSLWNRIQRVAYVPECPYHYVFKADSLTNSSYAHITGHTWAQDKVSEALRKVLPVTDEVCELLRARDAQLAVNELLLVSGIPEYDWIRPRLMQMARENLPQYLVHEHSVAKKVAYRMIISMPPNIVGMVSRMAGIQSSNRRRGKKDDSGRKRVLVWGLSNNRAGTETVVSTYVPHVPGTDFDFLCYEEPLNFRHLFDGTRNRYFVIPIKIKHPIANFRALRSFMREHADEYDALWFNVNDLSNIDLLKLAQKFGIPRRIAHFHNAGLPDVLVTKLFSHLNWKRFLKSATDYWACSSAAGDFVFKGRPYRVIPNLIDRTAVAFDQAKRKAVRTHWNITDDVRVIGTVGRLAEQKNHRFLVRMLPDLIQSDVGVLLMIVGAGELEEELRDLAEELGVGDHLILAGMQSDVQAYLSAFDAFAFPSLYEGLGISVMEAQFNGLPCVVSDGIPRDAVISSSVQVISLDDVPGWARSLLEVRRAEGTILEDRARMFDFGTVDEVAATLF